MALRYDFRRLSAAGRKLTQEVYYMGRQSTFEVGDRVRVASPESPFYQWSGSVAAGAFEAGGTTYYRVSMENLTLSRITGVLTFPAAALEAARP